MRTHSRAFAESRGGWDERAFRFAKRVIIYDLPRRNHGNEYKLVDVRSSDITNMARTPVKKPVWIVMRRRREILSYVSLEYAIALVRERSMIMHIVIVVSATAAEPVHTRVRIIGSKEAALITPTKSVRLEIKAQRLVRVMKRQIPATSILTVRP